MKKLVASITVLVYFVMTCGVVVDLHYCMGRIQSVDFYASEKEYCSKCGMHSSEAKGCCKNEVKIIKLQSDQNKASVSYSIRNLDAPNNLPSDFIVISFYNSDLKKDFNNHSPPLLNGQDTYLQNCVFRI